MNKEKVRKLEDKVDNLQGNKKPGVYVFIQREKEPNIWEHKGEVFKDEEKEAFVSRLKKKDTVINVVYDNKSEPIKE